MSGAISSVLLHYITLHYITLHYEIYIIFVNIFMCFYTKDIIRQTVKVNYYVNYVCFDFYQGYYKMKMQNSLFSPIEDHIKG